MAVTFFCGVVKRLIYSNVHTRISLVFEQQNAKKNHLDKENVEL